MLVIPCPYRGHLLLSTLSMHSCPCRLHTLLAPTILLASMTQGSPTSVPYFRASPASHYAAPAWLRVVACGLDRLFFGDC